MQRMAAPKAKENGSFRGGTSFPLGSTISTIFGVDDPTLTRPGKRWPHCACFPRFPVVPTWSIGKINVARDQRGTSMPV